MKYRPTSSATVEIAENRVFRIVFEVLQANDAMDQLLHRKVWSRDVVEY
ncbi:MAG: hypothetical protein GY696_37445 [Gammaproteobacteria bacterium]|nr:hypothetical protein [Gammaproteobacteria bacterium]